MLGKTPNPTKWRQKHFLMSGKKKKFNFMTLDGKSEWQLCTSCLPITVQANCHGYLQFKGEPRILIQVIKVL